MQNSRLIQQLKTLRSEEIKKFSAYISSPYFNTNPTLITLFNILKPFHPEYQDIKLTKLYVQKALPPSKAKSEGTLRNLMKDLTKALRNFLIQEQLEKNKALKERLLFNAYSERKFKQAFDSLYLNRSRQKKTGLPIDRYYHLEQYLTLEKYYHFPYTERHTISANHMSLTIGHLDRFFVLSQLTLKIEIIARKQLLNEELSAFHFSSGIKAFIEQLPTEEQSLFRLLQKIIEVQLKGKPAQIDDCIQMFQENYKQFSGFDSKMILKVLINQMNTVFQAGDLTYLTKMYSLFSFGLKNNIMLFDNSLTINDFLNIVSVSSVTYHSDWAFRFIKTHIKYLPQKDRAEAEILALAMVHFDQGKYDLVNQSLQNNSFPNAVLGFRYKLLLLKSFIEQAIQTPKEISWIREQFKVIERNIRRQSTKKGEKQRALIFLNLIKVLRKLLRTIENEGPSNKKDLLNLLDRYKPIAAKNWLLQKINSLE